MLCVFQAVQKTMKDMCIKIADLRWDENDLEKRMHWVAWSKMTEDKKRGNLASKTYFCSINHC